MMVYVLVNVVGELDMIGTPDTRPHAATPINSQENYNWGVNPKRSVTISRDATIHLRACQNIRLW